MTEEEFEPKTNAKVIIQTSMGDLQVELWGKQAPKASRNFLQLALEGYYDDTPFQRQSSLLSVCTKNSKLPPPDEFS